MVLPLDPFPLHAEFIIKDHLLRFHLDGHAEGFSDLFGSERNLAFTPQGNALFFSGEVRLAGLVKARKHQKREGISFRGLDIGGNGDCLVI